MSQKEQVLSFVREHPGVCDDCIATQLQIQPRQSVNIAARALTAADAVVRVSQHCASCGLHKIVNNPADAGPMMTDTVGTVAVGVTVPKATPRSGCSPILDGAKSLHRLLQRANSSVAQAIAEETVFLHPDTVAQTAGQPVFPVVRAPLNSPRGRVVGWSDGHVVEWISGRKWWADDNSPPTKAFLWAARRKKGPDVQFNHVWSGGDSPSLYTALWNLCATPAFLAKTTDSLDEVKALLRYRAYKLFGHVPAHETTPQEPEGYGELRWAPFPEAVKDLEGTYRAAMHSAPKNRTTIAARQLGWLFSGWQPDSKV